MHMHGPALPGGGATLDLAAFLMLGLLGSAAHCVGMCGPLVMLVARRYGAPAAARSAVAATAWYSVGRLTTYALLGAVAGGIGAGLQAAGATLGLHRVATVIAGVVLIVWGLVSLSSWAGNTQALSGWWSRLTHRLASRAPRHPAAAGLLLGLLPCGLVYTAVVAAMATGTAAQGALSLVAFGAGTVPALLGVSIADLLLGRHRLAVTRLAHVFVLAWGGWFLWRGLVIG